jgi:hypothetical protein
MNNLPISLCIPTKNRYDTFLNRYMEQYVTYLDKQIIDEIIVADEDGIDYDKFLNNKMYEKYLNCGKFRLYKNDKILGVFQNKLRVTSLAKNELVALIDSDNFCDETYFNTAREYINNNKDKLSQHFIVAPSRGKTNFNFTEYSGEIITKKNMGKFFNRPDFGVLLNTGNYVLRKELAVNVKYHMDKEILLQISACDVMYFLLLLFQQFDDFEFHVVNDLSYEHSVHDDSEYIKTYDKCRNFRDNVIKPHYIHLWKSQQ